MSVRVTVELPEELEQRARALAAQTHCRFEEALVEWINRAVTEPPVESLADEQLLGLCNDQMDAGLQEDLNDLLERSREGLLEEAERGRLDDLMQIYRRGLIRKAQALRAAVARGLRPPLN